MSINYFLGCIVVLLLIISLYKPHEVTESFSNPVETCFKNIWKPKDKDLALSMLGYFDYFCKKHKIKYFLMYGSLLGQVRHGGLIPWDDDLDVGVLSSDYEIIKRHFNTDKLVFHEVSKGFGKIFYKTKRSIDGHQWSWPFLDVFAFKLTDKGRRIQSDFTGVPPDSKNYYAADFFPLQQVPFENIKVLAPRKGINLLKSYYGDDWKTTCDSGYWNHREEKMRPQHLRTSCVEALKWT